MMDPLRLLLFLVLSIFAFVVSLHAWRTRQAYGTTRFLGFESLALLIVWVVPRWFREPLSIPQIASWLLFVGSTALAVHGFYLLRRVGRAQARIIEQTQDIVQVGAYRYVRHPLYLSLILFGWGVFFKGGDLLSAVLASVATLFWVATARYEEQFNTAQFGVAYTEYMRRTKMFVPFLL